MKKFQFRLQSLLKYKCHLEQAARQAVAQAVADILACEQRITQLQQDKESTDEQLESLVEKGIDASQFNRYRQFLSSLDLMIRREHNRKNELETILEKKREIYKQKTIEKKSLERLREKQAREYTHEMLQEEQKGLDEIAALKTAREVNNDGI